MPLSSETVSFAGSGLVFQNSYSAAVTDAYHSAILRAENALQQQFVTNATISVQFDIAPLSGGAVANNSYFVYRFDYATVRAALVSHATTPDDQLAVASLPTVDPSNGLGFAMTGGEAQALGLVGPSGHPDDDSITLSSTEPWTFGDDVVGAIEHELTEGGLGRVQDLGISSTHFSPFDLFRFTAGGQRDYTGGSDGQLTYFGVDGAHLSDFAFHNAISKTLVNDGGDFGDWEFTFFDAFGGGGGGISSGMSTVDIQVLDVLGWTPAAPAATDDFASTFGDTVHPMGQLTVGVAKTGSLELIGDRDWFKVQLNTGTDYLVTVRGQDGGGGSLDDPTVTLHDAGGAQIAFNDDADSVTFDSALIVHPAASGAYYVEAGSAFDVTPGTYTVTVQAGAAASTAGNDVLIGSTAGGTIMAGLGDDTIVADNASNYLRGEAGDDVITGGSGFDDANGNMGNDTIHGGAGDDYSVGGKDNDMLFGDSGNDIVWGNLGNDTCSGGSGDDQVRGGQGDDVVNGGSGNDYVSGDRGNDTITGGSGADNFHGSQDAGIDKVMDFSVAEGDRVQLDPGTTYTISQVGADTVLDMGGGNQMILVGVQMSSLLPSSIFLG